MAVMRKLYENFHIFHFQKRIWVLPVIQDFSFYLIPGILISLKFFFLSPPNQFHFNLSYHLLNHFYCFSYYLAIFLHSISGKLNVIVTLSETILVRQSRWKPNVPGIGLSQLWAVSHPPRQPIATVKVN